jgi:molecular chaperone GrpE
MFGDDERQGPVIRDSRKIDPVTGKVRETGEPGPQRGPGPAGGQRPGRHSVSRPGGVSTGAANAAPGGPPDSGRGGTPNDSQHGSAASSGGSASADTEARASKDAASKAQVMLAERTADLQRLQAEYANYRKRVERDRLAVREQALANVLNELVPVLDDIGRAREHGELTGGFKSVAESLEGIATKLGLVPFGEAGEPFDPTLHEALMHSYSADVTEPTAVQILQPGYKVGERIIRPARVAVAEPEAAGGSSTAAASDSTGEPVLPGAEHGEAEPDGDDATEGGDAQHDQPGAGDASPGNGAGS